jgi:hypothetical protein
MTDQQLNGRQDTQRTPRLRTQRPREVLDAGSKNRLPSTESTMTIFSPSSGRSPERE